MDHPVTRIVTFNDVDLSPEELFGDFAHDGLATRPGLGTIGLWCGLHDEAFLQAGMHHLECVFDFDALKEQLELEQGIRTMKPFTDFTYLRQAFTEGERWKVDDERIDRLSSKGLVTAQQAEIFAPRGPSAHTWRTWSGMTASRASTRTASVRLSPPPTLVGRFRRTLFETVKYETVGSR